MDYYLVPVILVVSVILVLIGYYKEDRIFSILAGFLLMIMAVYIALNGLEYSDPDVDSRVFDSQYIFVHTNETTALRGASLWTNISFGQEDADIKRGIEHDYNTVTNNTFTIMEDGIYDVDYDFDIEDISGTPSDIDVAARLVLVNGSEVVGSVFETDITKQGTEVELSHNFLVECRAGEQFTFQFVADDKDVIISTHGAFGIHPESATVLMMKIANL